MAVGRFAPSPTGDLHLGNLRTALVAWLFARSANSDFIVRMEDLDRVQASAAVETSQLRDLEALGLDWDGEVVRQSERFDLYNDAIERLRSSDLIYPCYCTRREIQQAPRAPQASSGAEAHLTPEGVYRGTCRELTVAEREERETAGRKASLRLRGPNVAMEVHDDIVGVVSAMVDDVVLRRNDGVPAYNLAVVVDDDAQGIEQIVRGDDLASSAPRQRHLADLLGLRRFSYAHVPMVLGSGGQRLAKRDGAVTLADQAAIGNGPAEVLSMLARSIGFQDVERSFAPARIYELVEVFSPSMIPREPWTVLGEDR